MLKTAILSTLFAAAIITPAMSADTMSKEQMAPAASASTAQKNAPGFTEKQARAHLAHQGYVNISRLTRNANGAWQGTAHKSGRTLIVAVRY